MSHNHKHTHSATHNIGLAFILNISFVVIEIIGGLRTNSVAILADAVHDFGDSIGLGFARLAQKYSNKKPDNAYSYGYKRYSLMAALLLGTLLLIGSVIMVYNAIIRLLDPEPVRSLGVIFLAVVGILVNGAGVYRVYAGQTQNEKIISRHLIEDVLGRVAVLIGGIIGYFTPRGAIVDPIIAIIFSLVVVYNAAKNTYQTIKLLTQGTPESVDLTKIRDTILQKSDVEDIHDMHCWSLDGEESIFTAHIVAKTQNILTIKGQIKKILSDEYHIHHSTLEFEEKGECVGGSCL